MTKPVADPPAVRSFADHEVILPPNKLKKAVVTGRVGSPEAYNPLARAQAALKELSREFEAWMQSECDRADAARHALKAKDLMDPEQKAELYRVSHDIRGNAATFGFPVIGQVADSLCRLLEHTPDPTRIPLSLLDQHVDAIRAILREHGSRGAAVVAEALCSRLRLVTEEFLAHENRERPDYLPAASAPPIAPVE